MGGAYGLGPHAGLFQQAAFCVPSLPHAPSTSSPRLPDPASTLPPPLPAACSPLNLEDLQRWVDDRRLPTDRVITMRDLRESNCVGRKMGWGVKLLARGAGQFSVPVHLQVGAEGLGVAGSSAGGRRRGAGLTSGGAAAACCRRCGSMRATRRTKKYAAPAAGLLAEALRCLHAVAHHPSLAPYA